MTTSSNLKRHCEVVEASVGHTRAADDDGAYDLFDVEGAPDDVGLAVAESLQELDLLRGGNWSYIENGADIYLNVIIRVRRTP